MTDETLAQALLDLHELTRRLRQDCPWDREQTAVTIVPHTVEEAYEVADAAIGGDPAKLADELGDLLFQVTFLALLLEEQGDGDLASVARAAHEKLVRRHPHVFGDGRCTDTRHACGSGGSRSSPSRKAAKASSTTFPVCSAGAPAGAQGAAARGHRRLRLAGPRRPARQGARGARRARERRRCSTARLHPRPSPTPAVAGEIGDLLFTARQRGPPAERRPRAGATRDDAHASWSGSSGLSSSPQRRARTGASSTSRPGCLVRASESPARRRREELGPGSSARCV